MAKAGKDQLWWPNSRNPVVPYFKTCLALAPAVQQRRSCLFHQLEADALLNALCHLEYCHSVTSMCLASLRLVGQISVSF